MAVFGKSLGKRLVAGGFVCLMNVRIEFGGSTANGCCDETDNHH